MTKKVDDTDNLVSVRGYYELNPEEDDRPEHIKTQLGPIETSAAEEADDKAKKSVWDELVALAQKQAQAKEAKEQEMLARQQSQ